MSRQQTGGERHWYAVHTYSGYEDAVGRNLRQRIASLGMENVIFNVLVPVEKKIKVKGNKRVQVDEKIYPGYVMVDMIVTDESWYVVRNTPRVTGFVGSGTQPVPMTDAEVEWIMGLMAKGNQAHHEISVIVGELIKIVDGPFKDMEGKVSEVDIDKGKIVVLVSMFGRETPVELDFLQIKKI